MVLSLNLYILNRQLLLTLYDWFWGYAVWNRWYVFTRISENIPTNNIRRLFMRSVFCKKKTVNNKLLLGKKITVTFYLQFHDQLHLWLVETSYQKFPARWFSVSISDSIMANPTFLVLQQPNWFRAAESVLKQNVIISWPFPCQGSLIWLISLNSEYQLVPKRLSTKEMLTKGQYPVQFKVCATFTQWPLADIIPIIGVWICRRMWYFCCRCCCCLFAFTILWNLATCERKKMREKSFPIAGSSSAQIIPLFSFPGFRAWGVQWGCCALG